jgi:gamma-glutamyltranspeptidase / glutathione hydrolase
VKGLVRALLSRSIAIAAGITLATGTAGAADRAEGADGKSAPFGPALTAVSSRGMVVAATPQAAEVGAAVLAAGGNAVDAAVATAFALAVTYPEAGNLAGGGFLVLRRRDGEVLALDFRETGPAAIRKGSFLGPDGKAVEGASTRMGLAVATPGTVRGLEAAHQRLGKLSWRSLVAEAARMAREGFPVTARLAKDLASQQGLFAPHPESLRIFFPGGRPIVEGATLVQPDLAATLDAIAERGADAFHDGPIALKIAAFVRSEGGVLTAEDLRAYRPVWRKPFSFEFGRWRLHTMPLPSSGGFLLASILGQLTRVGWTPAMLETPEGAHLVAEAERRAYAERNRWLGDGDVVDVPLARLLAPGHLGALARSIDRAKATPSARIDGGMGNGTERPQTTHLSVATVDGEAVSLTYTLNGAFGNGSVVPGVGVLLNNEMDDFAVAPGQPNLFGLVQGEQNAVRPGARPLSSMTPLIALEEGTLRLVLGSPGGSTIPTTVLQVFLRAGPGRSPLAEAVAGPRLHHQHLPDLIQYEKDGLPPETARRLRSMGHVLEPCGPIGMVHAIERAPNGLLTGAADPRGPGAPAAPAASAVVRPAPR